MAEKDYIYKIIEVKQKYRKTKKERMKITKPDDFYNFTKKLIGDSDREKLVVAGLNTKNEILYFEEVHCGGVNVSVADVRLIFKTALMNNAIAIIVGHNHPSGDPTMSSEDVAISKRLHYAGELINVQFLDHIVVTDEEFASFREEYGLALTEVSEEEQLERALMQYED